MHDFTSYLYRFNKITCELKQMFTTIKGAITMFFVTILPALSTTQQTLLLLAVLFVSDFITGIIASWIEFKKGLSENPNTIKGYAVSSEKMRMSGIKFITYGLGIITAYILESIFLLEEFEPSQLVNQKLTLTTVATLFFCTVEFYSIFFENIKRMGFDLPQTIKNMMRELWELYREVKDGSSK